MDYGPGLVFSLWSYVRKCVFCDKDSNRGSMLNSSVDRVKQRGRKDSELYCRMCGAQKLRNPVSM